MKALAIAIGLLLLDLCSYAQAPVMLKHVQTIALPGVEGQIDHLACDVAGLRLFVAALGNNTVEVLDLRQGVRSHSIRGLKEPQGLAYLPSMDRLFVANGQGEGVDIFDAKSYRKVGSATLGDDSDNVRLMPSADNVLVGYGGGALAVVGKDGGVDKRMPLPGHPESFQISRADRLAYVNVPSARQVVVFSIDTGKRIAQWEVSEASSNYPMTLDEAHHRLFVGCRNPAKVLVYDTRTGRPVARLDIVADTDDIFFDAARKRLYVIGGGGAVNVFGQEDPDHYKPLSTIAIAPGARTGLFVPDLRRLYVAVPHRGAQKAEVRVYETQP